MKIGALVPARIGSKRLPKKNIKILGDKPLICWTIDVLLEADIFYDITVSTESDEIADVVRQYYSKKEVKILKRPEELAQDDSPMREVIFHYLENRKGLDWYGVFLPTFPFRKKERLLEAYEAILSRYPWRIYNVTQKQYCLLDFYYPVEKGVMRFFRKPPLYCRFGMPIYVLENIKYPQELWDYFGLTPSERVYRLIVTFKESVDIDTKEDFLFAKSLLDNENLFGYLHFKEVELNDRWIFICPKDFAKIDEIVLKFNSQLRDSSLPLLVLKKSKIPVSFLSIRDGYARDYINSNEAKKKIINEKVIQTQNMRYFPTQYCHSEIFRFIRIKSDNLNFNDNTELLGNIYKAEYDSGESLIPWERIIFEKDILSIQ